MTRGQVLDDAPHVPVVIVGAGACGLTAAIGLRLCNIECVVLERDARPRGSTALSSGFIPAAGTRVQRALGIVDTRECFAQDVQAKAHGDAAQPLLDAYTGAVAQAIDALELQGMVFEVLGGFLYPGHRALRMHAVPERTGAALMDSLERTAQAAGVDILTDALVRVLHLDGNGRVQGVGYLRPDGAIEDLRCDVLLLACNGFGGNTQMVHELLPEMREATYVGHAGNDGSAIGWARQIGARLADLGGYQGHGSWAIPQAALMSWAVMMQGGVQINCQGARFHDETLGYSEAAVHVLAQPGGMAWNVFDTPLLELARTFPEFAGLEKAGAVKSAADLRGLARLIGCEEAALHATLASVAPGQPDPLGRIFQRPLAPPYHAVRVTGTLFHTQGGLDIDAHCRVLQESGVPFDNLLAAGGAARGVSGNAVWGYLSGNGLLSAVGGGWIAAQTAAHILKSAISVAHNQGQTP